jgi:hypothetical protein
MSDSGELPELLARAAAGDQAAERYWRWARRNPAIAALGGALTTLPRAAK